MEEAKAMAEHLFGPLSLITAQTNLKLALALCLDPCRKQEGLDLLESVEQQFHDLSQQLKTPEDHDLLFNLLFEF
jgi:hypothetical protein